MVNRISLTICFVHPFSHLCGIIRLKKYCEIGRGVAINSGKHGVVVGEYSQINFYSVIYGNVSIGDRVLIAPHVIIASGGHLFGKNIQPRFSGGDEDNFISIGDDVWIGANVCIVGAVTIGRGSVIGAGITVDRDIPPETLVKRGANSFTIERIR
jgi:acetyltransferase-like isoleucine patch superfamily enzyme